VWSGLVVVGPHAGDHRVALRAAVSVAVPLVAVWLLGRLDLSVYASFGAFAALYGRNDAYVDRVRMQTAAGAVLIGAMFAGTALSLSAAPAVVRVVAVAVIAVVVALIAAAGRWHPPGALFAVFAAGTCATIPARGGSLLAVLVVGGLSAAFAVGLTAAIALLRRRGHATPWTQRAARPPIRPDVPAALTVGAGALLAGMAGLLLVGTHWYWAMVGAVAALGGAHVTARVVRGVQRLIGTLLGVLVAAGLLALHLPPLAVIVAAIALQAAAEMFVGRNYAIAMVFITPLALLMVELAAPTDPGLLLRDRVVDTLIGVAVGTLVAVASATLRRARPSGLG
jgi:hypothetical protein